MDYNEIVNLINGNLADLSDIHPDEHRAVEKAILDYAKEGFDNLNLNIPTQVEVLANLYLGISDLGDEYPTGGGLNFGSAEFLAGGAVDTMYQIYYNEPLTGNYFLSAVVESRSTQSSGWSNDNDVVMMIKDPDVNGVKILLREVSGNFQYLRIHITAVKY